ncbi:hypothetical protein BTN50_1989 [Candidatus Enterovibrio altilux]|uniref:Uncharacterized protein n=1 Tax=Candidatus Enterovibrio altilux TaxID=1927128 RepID=A0A291BBP0_9GAMM|nr:hypothetical protein BTN50_1989 [Candidatus Enterovibrio luxaltus]
MTNGEVLFNVLKPTCHRINEISNIGAYNTRLMLQNRSY